MTDQLFNDENTNPQATPEQTNTPSVNTNDLFSDQLAAIKNESGEPKYDSLEKALDALKHSQSYIPELKTELSSKDSEIIQLKAKLEAMEKVEDIVNRQTSQPEGETTNQSLGEEEIAALIDKAFNDNKTKTLEYNNQAKVNEALQAMYGANAQAEVQKRAKELGMKPSEIGALSKTNPAAALALFGEKIGSPSTTTSSYNLPSSTTPEPLKAPEKSLLSGATTKEQVEFFKKVKEDVYREYGIET